MTKTTVEYEIAKCCADIEERIENEEVTLELYKGKPAAVHKGINMLLARCLGCGRPIIVRTIILIEEIMPQ